MNIRGYIRIEEREEEDKEDKIKENEVTLKDLKWINKYFLGKTVFEIITFIE